MYYEDLQNLFKDSKVELSYFKKSGAHRVFVGYLGKEHVGRPDMVYFVEKPADDDPSEVKLLFKRNIDTIKPIDFEDDRTFQIIGG